MVDEAEAEELAALLWARPARVAAVCLPVELVDWARLEDDAYTMRRILALAESEDRGRVATLTRAFGIMRELLKRRPAEFGGPREVMEVIDAYLVE